MLKFHQIQKIKYGRKIKLTKYMEQIQIIYNVNKFTDHISAGPIKT